MFEINSDDEGGFTVKGAGRANEFLELPCGDFIRPMHVQAVRVQQERADRSGEVAAKVHIDHRGSWFTVQFPKHETARAWARSLMAICDSIANTGSGANVENHPYARADLVAEMNGYRATEHEQ
jgi:hypothetical protein